MLASGDIQEAAAVGRAATAADAKRVGRNAVVERELFTCTDPAAAEEQDVAANDAGTQIGRAAMIDKLGAGAAKNGINPPITVEPEHIKVRATWAQAELEAGEGYAPADPLTGKLNDFSAGRNAADRENTPAVNAGTPHTQWEGGKGWIDGGGIGTGWLHGRGKCAAATREIRAAAHKASGPELGVLDALSKASQSLGAGQLLALLERFLCHVRSLLEICPLGHDEQGARGVPLRPRWNGRGCCWKFRGYRRARRGNAEFIEGQRVIIPPRGDYCPQGGRVSGWVCQRDDPFAPLLRGQASSLP